MDASRDEHGAAGRSNRLMRSVVAAASVAAVVLLGAGGTDSRSDRSESGGAGYAATQAQSLSGATMRPHRAAALVALATGKAEAHWGGTRCANVDLLYRRLGDRRIAEAVWFPSALDPTVYENCSITFDTSAITFAHYCATLVHEYGHLAGFHEDGGPDLGQHAGSSRRVMHPVISDRNVPKTCRTIPTAR